MGSVVWFYSIPTFCTLMLNRSNHKHCLASACSMLILARRTFSTTIKKTIHEVSHNQKNAGFYFTLRHKNSTVDNSEVEKHSRLSEEWWATDGCMKPLHAMNAIRIPFVRDGLLGKNQVQSATPLKNQKILDVGCGGGILAEPLARLGASVTGIDASPELIELAQNHSKLDPRLTHNPPLYIHTTVEDHATKHAEHYDAVVASEIIEHVTDKELFVKSCLTCLQPGGSIFFTTPNRTWLSWLGAIVISENVLGIVPKGTHEYDKLTTPTELSHMLERHNCKIQAVYGEFYSFINNKWYFTRSQEFMFALHAIKKT